MSQHKAAGSSKNGRDSRGRRLGVKLFGGQIAYPGSIIIRQRGTKYMAGDNVKTGKDHTLYALKAGKVAFSQKSYRKFDGKKYAKTLVHVSE